MANLACALVAVAMAVLLLGGPSLIRHLWGRPDREGVERLDAAPEGRAEVVGRPDGRSDQA